MSRALSWWRGLTGPAKFRLYSKLTLQGGIAGAVVAAALGRGEILPGVGIILAGVATLVAVEVQPQLAGWPSREARRIAFPAAASVIATVWATAAVVANAATTDSVIDTAHGVGVISAVLGMLAVLPFVRHTWWWLVAVCVATGVVFGVPTGDVPQLVGAMLLLGGFVVSVTALTLWGLNIVDDLERSKDVEAELQLAEERLRFARDLHDVVGRSFSAIAVKSELAGTLSRAGAADRAADEMDEVKALAVESMAEMRQLVRGYRDIDLEGEVAGARSLLSATGCMLEVEGDPATVPVSLHELAAWVVREGTTNIVRHASAQTATLAFGRTGMSLRNDGATGVAGERSGLRGLAERLAVGGASLETSASGSEFVLQVHWEAA